MQETEMMLSTIVSMQAGGGGGSATGEKRDETVMDACARLYENLPENIDWEDVRERNESDSSPLKVCLLQEIERYNELLSKTRESIRLLQQGIQGFIVISKEQEDV